jgi:hypothetical protein
MMYDLRKFEVSIFDLPPMGRSIHQIKKYLEGLLACSIGDYS